MSKIEMKTPLVEMDGDEMTRIIWQIIKERTSSSARTSTSRPSTLTWASSTGTRRTTR